MNESDTPPTAPENEESSIVASINPEGVIQPELDNASPFEKYYEDQSETAPKQKIPLILMYSMTGIVVGFSLSSLHETPYKEQNIHSIKPKKSCIKEEIKRLNPSANRLSAATLGELLEMLAKLHADHFTEGCRQFIIKKHGEVFELFKKSIEEKNEEETRTASRLTDCDRLRFVEAMISDEVRDVYRLSQESLTRSELDSRNSTERDPTFTEKISDQFNDDSWKPFTTAYPTLHSDFVAPILCERIGYVMTPEKAKEIVNHIRPMLKKMIVNYEESGQGCMSKHDDTADWGNFDIELCDGNDDRSRFLLHQQQTYLLYWWAKLDEYNLLSFTCGQISPHLTANTDFNPSICSARNTDSPKKKKRKRHY